jgi:hypothetical protein
MKMRENRRMLNEPHNLLVHTLDAHVLLHHLLAALGTLLLHVDEVVALRREAPLAHVPGDLTVALRHQLLLVAPQADVDLRAHECMVLGAQLRIHFARVPIVTGKKRQVNCLSGTMKSCNWGTQRLLY